MHKTVVLSDGEPCKVRVLGLFELDSIKAEILGPYSYSILTVTGQVIEDTYDLRALEEIPIKPANDNPEPGTTEWKQLQEYETYLAALAHEHKRIESYANHLNEVAAYILANCLDESDRQRVVEPDDWRKIQEATLVPMLTEAVLTETLARTFPGLVWQVGDTASVSGGGAGTGDGQGDSLMGVTND